MPSSADYVEFIKEQLRAIRGVQSGRLFGSVGLTLDGVYFAIIVNNVLYFVVDDTTRPQYEQWGSECFAYATKTKRVNVRRYYAVPPDRLEDADELVALARESIRIARATVKRK